MTEMFCSFLDVTQMEQQRLGRQDIDCVSPVTFVALSFPKKQKIPF